MTLFLIGLILCLSASLLVMGFYIKTKRQEEKKEEAEIKEKFRRAAQVYEEEKKENEKIIEKNSNISSVDDFNNSIEQLRKLSEKGRERNSKTN